MLGKPRTEHLSNDEFLKKNYTLHYKDTVEDSRANKMKERVWKILHT